MLSPLLAVSFLHYLAALLHPQPFVSSLFWLNGPEKPTAPRDLSAFPGSHSSWSSRTCHLKLADSGHSGNRFAAQKCQHHESRPGNPRQIPTLHKTKAKRTSAQQKDIDFWRLTLTNSPCEVCYGKGSARYLHSTSMTLRVIAVMHMFNACFPNSPDFWCEQLSVGDLSNTYG